MLVYPEANLEPSIGGLLVHPAKTHVARVTVKKGASQ